MPSRSTRPEAGKLGPLPVLLFLAVVGFFIAPTYALGAKFLLVPGLLLGFTLTIAGAILVGSALNRQRNARLHTSGLPVTAIAQADDGAIVRVVGRVTSEPEIDAPFSGRRVVHAVTTVCQCSPRPAPKQRFKDGIWARELEIDDRTGRARVQLDGEALLSKHETRILGLSLHAGSSEAQRALHRRLGEIYPDVDLRGAYDLCERVLLPGDVLQVTGRVEREHGETILTRPTDRPLLITNLSVEEVEEMQAAAERLLPKGVYTLLLGAAAGGACLVWMLAH